MRFPLKLAALLATAAAAPTQTDSTAPTLSHGPFRGHADTTSIHVFARASAAGAFDATLTAVVDGAIRRTAATATEAHDFTLHFVFDGLAAGQAYTLSITAGDTVVHQGHAPWTTAMADDATAATVAFGSCANERGQPVQPIWGRVLARAPHALVLLGDTPYIDSTQTEVRRRRHREWFEFPPVAAMLATIPTWTTWDDHDYAANDQFGAVPGAASARAVFVDYHAHASHGDGTHGIWTRFRRGPIEVFLLDTRTAADQGESPLAPGERTLLGKAQLDWLQQGLRTSTAPCKVLACGMVWNEGVRPNKQDCWGHWLPERDGLFRWLGAQRIDGVVLVSGDVHRSRVIVHPTAAVVGYDVPEFVTSPLAQNVLESNAVPVPGLQFDAGEPQSCLFLEVAATAAGGLLRAVFQAGDGREFHRFESSLQALAKPDAAVVYRRLVRGLRTRLGENVSLPPCDYQDPTLGLAEAEACRDDWRAAVAAAATEFAAWQQLVDEPRCRFARTSSQPLLGEFMHELFLGLTQLRQLNTAAALQAIADRKPAPWLAAIERALTLARHLRLEPGGMAWSLAAAIEGDVLELRQRAAPFGEAVREPLRSRLADHEVRRLPTASLAPALREETYSLFTGSMAELRLGSDRQGSVARQFAQAVRVAFTAEVEPVLAALDAMPAEPSSEARAALRQAAEGLALRYQQRREALRELRQPGAAKPAAAADLGLALAALVLPNVPELHAVQLDVTLRLRAAAAAPAGR